MVWVVLYQHHITNVGTAADAAFQQIMAKHCFVSKALVKYSVHSLDIEQPLAGKRAQAKQILVQVRGAIAVRVNTALACKQGMEQRALCGFWQRCDNTWLQNTVATDHATAASVDVRRVQRMRCNRHQLTQGSRWQAGVAVQRHDILNATGQIHAIGKVKPAIARCGSFFSGNQPHQRFKFAALSLPANPLALGTAVRAPPVNQQKARCLPFCRRVGGIQPIHLRYCFIKQGGILGCAGLVCIAPVRQQRKLGVGLQAGQPVQFKAFDEQRG